MDRRPAALVSLSLCLLLTLDPIVLSGSRHGPAQGAAPAVLQVAGYVCALVGAVLLLAAPRAAGGDRMTGGVVLAVVVLLVALEVVTWATDTGGGANIGAGLVRLVGLVVLVAMTVRLASAVVERRRS